MRENVQEELNEYDGEVPDTNWLINLEIANINGIFSRVAVLDRLEEIEN